MADFYESKNIDEDDTFFISKDIIKDNFKIHIVLSEIKELNNRKFVDIEITDTTTQQTYHKSGGFFANNVLLEVKMDGIETFISRSFVEARDISLLMKHIIS